MEEEMGLYSIANIRSMEVIEIDTGTKLGYIRDLKVDCDNFNIISLIMPSEKVSLFGKNEEKEIPWDKVKKIGIDVILVEGGEYLFKE